MKQLTVFAICLLLVCSTGTLATVAPVAYWSFDNPADIGHDDSGNGHNGIVVGATTSTTGSWGNAGNFDGSSYIDVADAPGLNPTSQITITAWFKADSFALGWPNIVRKSNNDGTSGYGMEIQNVYENNPCISFVCISPGLAEAPFGLVYGVPVLTPGTWYFSAGVYDGDVAKVYVGTSELPPLVVTSRNGSGNIVSSSNNLMIGNVQIYGNRSFDGAIDEVRIYDRALNSDEITNLYLYNIPEPATLLLIGLGGLLLRKRRA